MKFSFSNEGLFALQDILYQLPDEALKVECELVLHDVISWMISYFLFTVSELIFLNGIDGHVRKQLSFDISFAVENRLPISLNNVALQVIYAKNQRAASSNITRYKACGTLQINVDYPK